MSVFTENIKTIKKVYGISSNRIANMAGIPPSTMSRIESDEHRPNIGTVEKVSRALGVDARSLLFERLDEETLSNDRFLPFRNREAEHPETIELRLKIVESELAIIKKHLGV